MTDFPTDTSTPTASANSSDTSGASSASNGAENQDTFSDDDFVVNWNEVEEMQEAKAQKEKAQREAKQKAKENSGAKVTKSSADDADDTDENAEEADEAEDKSDDSPEEGQEPKEKLIKVKVNGEEFEITEAEAAKAYELAMGARQKFNEAKQLREQAEQKEKNVSQFLQQLKTVDGVMSLIEYAKIDQKELFKALHAELTMPEEDRRWRELQRREAALKDKEAEKAKLREEQKMQKETKNHIQRLTLEIGNALKTEGIENNAHNIKLVSRLLLEAQKANTKLSTEGAVTMLKAQIRHFQAEANKQRNEEARAKVHEAVKPLPSNKEKAKSKQKKIRPLSEFGASNLSEYYDQWSSFEGD